MALVYLVTNRVNGKRYIGATKQRLSRRRAGHLCNARNGKGWCRKFYAAIRKYGEDEFDWSVLCECLSFEDAMLHEARLIAEMRPEYNLTAGGRGSPGAKRTPEQIARWRAANPPRKWTEQQRRLFREARMGHVHSAETKAKLSSAHKGKKLTDEHRAKLSASHLGNGHSAETRAKMSATRKGKPRPRWIIERMLAGRRRQIAEARYGQ